MPPVRHVRLLVVRPPSRVSSCLPRRWASPDRQVGEPADAPPKVQLSLDLVAMDRQEVIAVLTRAGLPDLAAKVEAELPDPVEMDKLESFGRRHGVSRDWLISRMAGALSTAASEARASGVGLVKSDRPAGGCTGRHHAIRRFGTEHGARYLRGRNPPSRAHAALPGCLHRWWPRRARPHASKIGIRPVDAGRPLQGRGRDTRQTGRYRSSAPGRRRWDRAEPGANSLIPPGGHRPSRRQHPRVLTDSPVVGEPTLQPVAGANFESVPRIQISRFIGGDGVQVVLCNARSFTSVMPHFFAESTDAPSCTPSHPADIGHLRPPPSSATRGLHICCPSGTSRPGWHPPRRPVCGRGGNEPRALGHHPDSGCQRPPAAGAQALHADPLDRAAVEAALGGPRVGRGHRYVERGASGGARQREDVGRPVVTTATCRAGRYTGGRSGWHRRVAAVVDGDPGSAEDGDYAWRKRSGELAAVDAFGGRALVAGPD